MVRVLIHSFLAMISLSAQFLWRSDTLFFKGPIIRISPHELHIMDPTYHQTLYRQEGHWNKYPWNYDAFTSKGSTICTTDHDLHKARRAPLNSFFSKAKVSAQRDMMQRNAEKLCDRLSNLSNTTCNLGAAISAFTQDVATEFIPGRNYHSLDREDFNVGMTGVFQKSAGRVWCTTKYLRWFGPTMKAMPANLVIKMADENTQSFFRYIKVFPGSQLI
jgi:cytochrome P450